MKDLGTLLDETPYHDYVYSYPHKTAYRTLDPAPRLPDVWADEERSALFLYVHVPFCEMRCGFCNLFTEVGGAEGRVQRYLDALALQAEATKAALPEARFAQMAVGGGTPTVLSLAGLERLFDLAADFMGADSRRLPTSIEVSPATVTTEKLDLLRGRGVRRVSVGVQSFETRETDAVFRPQPPAEVEAALARLRTAGFPDFNIDLVYGLPGQTGESLLRSIDRALEYGPTELYLYPLYVRSLTTLGRRAGAWEDARLVLYARGRDHLLSRGFDQCSLRRFRAPGAPQEETGGYRCQEDGMVGLGAGARSYTRRLHYSTRYGVAQSAIRDIVDEYLSRGVSDHARVSHGFALDGEEERRRFLILSLLEQGLEGRRFRERFGAEPQDEFPELGELVERGLARRVSDRLELTPEGVTWSDTIGHWLFSERVRERMAEYRPS